MESTPPPPPLSDSAATSAMVALRYWARATAYEPNEEEKRVLTACEERSVLFWRAGLVVGGGAGLALANVSKVNLTQQVAVAAGIGSAASIWGQYKANRPCLQDLFELRANSPLGGMARQIMREGGQAAVQRMHREVNAQQHAAAATPPPASPPNRVVTTAHAPDDGASAPDDSHGQSDPSHSDGYVGGAGPQAAPADSWEAVRQRYQARRLDENADRESAREAVLVPPSLLGAGSQGRAAAPTEHEHGGPRRRRNAYGDEVLE